MAADWHEEERRETRLRKGKVKKGLLTYRGIWFPQSVGFRFGGESKSPKLVFCLGIGRVEEKELVDGADRRSAAFGLKNL